MTKEYNNIKYSEKTMRNADKHGIICLKSIW